MDQSDDDRTRKLKDLLAQVNKSDVRLSTDAERRAQFAKRDEISQGWQAKAERKFEVQRKAAQQEAISANTKAEAAVKGRIAAEATRLKNRLKASWGQRLGHYKGERPDYTGAKEWGKYTPTQLLRMASHYPPRLNRLGGAVTDFSTWVFRLEHPDADSLGLELGRTVERNLLFHDKQDAARKALNTVTAVQPSKARWRVLYQDDLSSSGESFSISGLRINERCLVGRPDLVLQEISTGEVFIVERKASNFKPPTNCWHNVRAQLWAYSMIDEWSKHDAVTLCAETWSYTPTGEPIDFVIQTWKREDPIFTTCLAELFDAYRAGAGAA